MKDSKNGEETNQPAGAAKSRRLEIISSLFLFAAFPLSAGILFDSAWLRWIGIVLIGVGLCCFGVAAIPHMWWYMHLPKCKVAKTESKTVMEAYVRHGWTLKHVWPDEESGRSTEYLLEWQRDGDPVRIDVSKVVETEKDA